MNPYRTEEQRRAYLDALRRDEDIVRRALIRRWKAGQDVGEFLVAVAGAADAQLYDQEAGSLTSNRQGSWEAAILQSMIEQGGR